MSVPIETRLLFDELLELTLGLGYDLLDEGGKPVDETLLSALEDDNLMAAQVQVMFREPPFHGDPAIVADVQVGEQMFQISGNGRDVEDLRNGLHDIAERRGGKRQSLGL
jgi:hypothetical protein